VATRLSFGDSPFATRRPGVRIPSRPPNKIEAIQQPTTLFTPLCGTARVAQTGLFRPNWATQNQGRFFPPTSGESLAPQLTASVLAEYTRSHRFDAAVAGLTSRLTHVGLSIHSAQQQALARMYSVVMAQAQALSYVDIYWLLAATSAVMFLLCFLLAKNEPGKGGQVAVH
jgi:hypothetical protein